MPRYLATYDLQNANPDPHAEYIKQAALLGWQTWILSNKNLWYKLPNTTVEGLFADQSAACAALKQAGTNTAAQGYKVNMEKWIVVEYGVSNFNSDVTQPKG